jgi:hypothetical protein
MSLPEKTNIQLPMMMFATICKEDNDYVAHALNFDIVSVGPTEEEAVHKMRLAVKTYIEFGLQHNLDDDILYPAPKEFWDRISQDMPIKMMEPIEVMHRKLLVFTNAKTHVASPTAQVA